MTTALIGLGGVLLGVVAALLGPVLTDRRHFRSEARRWRRDQLATAYEQALRYLLRAANRRSLFQGGRGGAVLNQEHQREWFDDLVEAQVWLRTVARYCDANQVDRIRRTAERLDKYVSRLVSGERFDRKDFSIWKVLQSCITTVTECARIDEGDSTPIRTERDEAGRTVFSTEGNPQVEMTEGGGSLREEIRETIANTMVAPDEPEPAMTRPADGTKGADQQVCQLCGSHEHTDEYHENIPFN